MNKTEKMANMTEAAKQLADMIQKRLDNRIETLNALSFTSMDGLPDDVKKLREEQSATLRGSDDRAEGYYCNNQNAVPRCIKRLTK